MLALKAVPEQKINGPTKVFLEGPTTELFLLDVVAEINLRGHTYVLVQWEEDGIGEVTQAFERHTWVWLRLIHGDPLYWEVHGLLIQQLE